MKRENHAIMNITGGSFLINEQGRPEFDESKYRTNIDNRPPISPEKRGHIDERSNEAKFRANNRRMSIKSRESYGSGNPNYRGAQGS